MAVSFLEASLSDPVLYFVMIDYSCEKAQGLPREITCVNASYYDSYCEKFMLVQRSLCNMKVQYPYYINFQPKAKDMQVFFRIDCLTVCGAPKWL